MAKKVSPLDKVEKIKSLNRSDFYKDKKGRLIRKETTVESIEKELKPSAPTVEPKEIIEVKNKTKNMKKRKFKLSLKNYYKPTPKELRKLGDSLLAVSVFIAGSSYALEYHWLSLTAFILAVAGKFMTNFWSVEEPTK